MPLLAPLISLLVSFLPRILGALLAVGPAVAGIAILVSALAAGYVGVNAARLALETAMGAYGRAFWCGMTACGASEFLFWFISGVVIAFSYTIAKKIQDATQSVTSKLAGSLTK